MPEIEEADVWKREISQSASGCGVASGPDMARKLTRLIALMSDVSCYRDNAYIPCCCAYAYTGHS